MIDINKFGKFNQLDYNKYLNKSKPAISKEQIKKISSFLSNPEKQELPRGGAGGATCYIRDFYKSARRNKKNTITPDDCMPHSYLDDIKPRHGYMLNI